MTWSINPTTLAELLAASDRAAANLLPILGGQLGEAVTFAEIALALSNISVQLQAFAEGQVTDIGADVAHVSNLLERLQSALDKLPDAATELSIIERLRNYLTTQLS